MSEHLKLKIPEDPEWRDALAPLETPRAKQLRPRVLGGGAISRVARVPSCGQRWRSFGVLFPQV